MLPRSVASASCSTSVIVNAGPEEAGGDAFCEEQVSTHMPLADAACAARDDYLQAFVSCKQAIRELRTTAASTQCLMTVAVIKELA